MHNEIQRLKDEKRNLKIRLGVCSKTESAQEDRLRAAARKIKSLEKKINELIADFSWLGLSASSPGMWDHDPDGTVPTLDEASMTMKSIHNLIGGTN